MPITAIVFAGFVHETMAQAKLGHLSLEKPANLPHALAGTLPNGLCVVFHALPIEQVMVAVGGSAVIVELYDPQAQAGAAAWIRAHL